MLTAWGYSVDELPPIVTVDEFNAMTGGIYSADVRVSAAIKAVSAVIRNYCNWHVSPVLDCSATLTAHGKLIQLPALVVTDVTKVVDGGEELSEGQYEWQSRGLVRRACFKQWSQAWGGVTIEYGAGIDAPELAQLVVSLTAGIMDAPTGVSSEQAGNVSISWDADLSRVDSALNERTKAMLTPYRIQDGA